MQNPESNLNKNHHEIESDLTQSTSILDQEWPTDNLRKKLDTFSLPVTLKDFPMGTGWVDITTQSKICDFARKFEPKVLLQGQGLISEKNSESWCGMLYRVLENENQSQRIIQYIYVWTKQQLPFTFWNWVLPLLALFLISIYTNTDTQIYSSNLESAEGIPVVVASILTSQFHPGFSVILSLILIFGFGGFEFQKLWRKKDFSLRLLIFPLLGVLYLGFLIIELLSDSLIPSPLFIIDLDYFFYIFNVETDMADVIINIGLLPVLLFSLTIISIFGLYYQTRILKIRPIESIINFLHAHLSHDMDYAPVFMYLIQSNNNWTIAEICWDQLHYTAGLATPAGGKEVNKLDFLENNHRPIMKLKGNWHSFQPYSSFDRRIGQLFWLINWFSLICLIVIGVWLTITNLNVFGNLEKCLEPVIGLSLANFVATLSYRFLYPIAFFWCAYYIVTRRKRPLLEKADQNLCQLTYYHFSKGKCQYFWSLPKLAEFVIQEKLQNPVQVKKERTFRNK